MIPARFNLNVHAGLARTFNPNAQAGTQARGRLRGRLRSGRHGELGGELNGELGGERHGELGGERHSELGGELGGELHGELGGKLRSRGGFSLSEMLVCVMLLAIAGAAITQALSLGMAQFHERTVDSEAITLGNSIAVEVRDQLAFATSFDGGENSTFVSTANTLRNVPCAIVSVDESGDPVDAGGYGYVALRYEVEQSNGKVEEFNYFPVSTAEYDKGDIQLAARVDYEYDSGTDSFNVKVSVRDTTSRLAERTQEFAVSPIAPLT